MINLFKNKHVIKGWCDFQLHWCPILKWSLHHLPTGSALLISDTRAKRLMKLWEREAKKERWI